MRLKEDSTSWRAGGIKKRDFRHDPGLPDSEIPKYRKKRKKVRRNRCKHTYTTLNRYYYEILLCSKCGRREWKWKRNWF